MALGSARDFGNVPNIAPDPANPRMNPTMRELGLLDDTPELTEEEIAAPFAGEVVEYDSKANITDELALMQYFAQAQQPVYILSATDLAILKNEGIIEVEEARDYLRSKGVLG